MSLATKTQPTDYELFQAAGKNAEAFGQLYDRHWRWLASWLQRELRDPDIATDLLAETFAQALRSRRRFQPAADNSAAPWLFGIARNLVLSYYRSQKRQVKARQKLQMSEDCHHPDESEAITERVDADQLAAELKTALTSLPKDQRQAVELRILQDYSYEETATELDCSQQTARKRVSRGLTSLKKILQTTGEL